MTDRAHDAFWTLVSVVFAIGFFPHWYALVFAFFAGVLWKAFIEGGSDE